MMEATSLNAWETILKAGKGIDVNCYRHRIEEQRLESGLTSEDEEGLKATAL